MATEPYYQLCEHLPRLVGTGGALMPCAWPDCPENGGVATIGMLRKSDRGDTYIQVQFTDETAATRFRWHLLGSKLAPEDVLLYNVRG